MNVKKLIKIARKLPDIQISQAVQFVTLLAAFEKATDLSDMERDGVKVALGDAFRRMRQRARLTQKQFCDLAGISQQQLSLLESGKAGINAYAPAFFTLSVGGTEAMLEKASELEAAMQPDLKPEGAS